ncbi:hypothetical protein LZ30DRAFT_144767 [Colletotrichum cereale]|nr:hypothetical protein LZ30DRAFT_144767 [Colletotrichum cereale]
MLGTFNISTEEYHVLLLDRSVGEGNVNNHVLGQGPFCISHTTGVVQDSSGAYCTFDKTNQGLRCRHDTTGEPSFQLNINRQPDGTSAAILSQHHVDKQLLGLKAQLFTGTDTCLPPWYEALKWCQDHPGSNKCPWLPWTLEPQTFKSHNADALRAGLQWALSFSCLLFPDACSSFKVEDAMNVLSNINLEVAIQGLQDSLGARCEASPLLCPYVPLTMEAILSAMEVVSDVTRLVHAVLAGAGHKNLGRRAPSSLVQTAQTDFGVSGQPTTGDVSKPALADIVQWFRSIVYDICEKRSPSWCQYVHDLLDFVEDIFTGTEECHATLGRP